MILYSTIILIAFGLCIGSYALKANYSSSLDIWIDVRSTLLHQGSPRTFWMYFGMQEPSAIIFTLMGWNLMEDKCDWWHKVGMSSYGLRKKARKLNAALVTPCPLSSPDIGPEFVSGWGYNAGTCCQSNKSVDDIDFVRQLIPEVESRLGVAGLPVYALGYSNGGMLAEALLCYNIVSQAASVAGILTLEPGLGEGFKVCDDVFNPIPNKVQRVIKIHGQNDKLVPYNGGYDRELPFMIFPSVKSDFSRWAKRMGCNRKSRRKIGKRGDAVIEKYKTCPEGKEVYLASMKGVGHAWPKRHCLGDFSATRAIFELFYGTL